MESAPKPQSGKIARLSVWLLLLILGTATNAWAYKVELLEDAHELRLTDVRLPTTGTGSITFRGCASCVTTSMRLIPTARYRVNGADVALPDFLATVARIRASGDSGENSSITVFFDIRTRQLTRIELFEF